MSTSLKIFASEFEQSLNSKPGSHPPEKIHSAYPTLPFTENQLIPGFTVIGVVRDPIERFISGYKNKISRKLPGRLGNHLSRAGLNPKPSPDEFALNLRDYINRSTFLAHHFLPQITYLGAEPNLYDRFFRPNRSHLLESFLTERLGVQVQLSREQSSSRAAPLLLGSAAIKALRQFYAADFETFGPALADTPSFVIQNPSSRQGKRKKQKRIVLHIGHHKTGSTAIQSGLALNHNALEKQGIVVSAALGGPNNVIFSSLFSNRIPRRLRRDGVSSQEQWKKMVRENSLWERLDDEIDSMALLQHTYLVSAEHLSGLSSEQIHALVEWAGRRFEQVDVVCYVRDQVTAIPSRWQMTVQAGSTVGLRRFTASLVESGKLNRVEFAKRWVHAAPHANLQFYEFPGDDGEDVVRHFFTSALELDDSELRYEARRANESLSFATTQALRLINSLFPLESFGTIWGNQSNQRLRRWAKVWLRYSSRKPVLSNKSASNVRQFFAESNRAFAGQYLTSMHRNRSEPAKGR